jgi:hypothetical protein
MHRAALDGYVAPEGGKTFDGELTSFIAFLSCSAMTIRTWPRLLSSTISSLASPTPWGGEGGFWKGRMARGHLGGGACINQVRNAAVICRVLRSGLAEPWRSAGTAKAPKFMVPRDASAYCATERRGRCRVFGQPISSFNRAGKIPSSATAAMAKKANSVSCSMSIVISPRFRRRARGSNCCPRRAASQSGARPSWPRPPYPAQHDSCFTSLVNVCAASFRPSTIVR